MKFPDGRILIFAKAPVIGHCKTRLIPELGADGATELHQRLVNRCVETAVSSELCQIQLWTADEPDHPFFQDYRRRSAVTLLQQHGTDLGQRMHHALSHALKEAAFAILFGTDCPGFSADYFGEALTALAEGKEVVLGPAHDGGYVLIGLRRPQSMLFENMVWGNDRVLSETRRRLHTADLSVHELAPQYDIDRPADLIHLPPEFNLDRVRQRFESK